MGAGIADIKGKKLATSAILLLFALSISTSLFGCDGVVSKTTTVGTSVSQATTASSVSSSSSVAPDKNSSSFESAASESASSTVTKPASNEVHVQDASLIVDGDPSVYNYGDLAADIKTLAARYPDLVHIESAGRTVDGRDVFHIVIGGQNAENHVLVHAGIHAREYITTQLVMKQASSFLKHLAAGDSYGDVRYSDMLASTAIHVVPSVNPDGMALSQQGIDAIANADVRNRLLEIAAADGSAPSYEYFRTWKANANGVDLNRNFDALWSSFVGTTHPSTERYKGVAPGCEVESRALIDLTERYGFARTISYHAMGSVIYWYFGQEGELLESTRQFAEAVSAATGYRLDANYEYLDPAGYKDWALQAMNIPSLTVEVGLGDVPVSPDQFQDIWLENEHVWEETLTS